MLSAVAGRDKQAQMSRRRVPRAASASAYMEAAAAAAAWQAPSLRHATAHYTVVLGTDVPEGAPRHGTCALSDHQILGW